MTSLEWWCDLGIGFVASAGLLTETFSTRISDYTATVHLPSLPADARVGDHLTQPQIWGAGTPSGQWGMIHQVGAAGSMGVVVKRLLFSAELTDPDVEIQGTAEAIVNAMETWGDGLLTWLEVVTGQHLTDIGHREVPVIGGKTPIWQVSPDQSESRPAPRTLTLEVCPPDRIPGVTAELLASCLSLVPNGPPDLPWVLLRDARSLAEAGQHRRAVIDAATAAELAITRMMDTLLESVDTAEREVLRREHQTLGSKMGLLKKRGQPLADDLYEKLVAKRNDAVHEGRPVGSGHCDIAIAAAADVVEMAYPLPDLLGGRRWPARSSAGHDEWA